MDCRINEITRPVNRLSADQILDKAGYKRLGNGAFGAVYEKPGVDYVLKVFSSTDRAYIDFIKLVKSYPNKHFPKFIGKVVKVNDVYSAIRMEKLSGMHNHNVANLMQQYCVYRNVKGRIGYERLVDVLDWLSEAPELKTALDLILDNLAYELDLRTDNIMKRGNTYVITDPVKWFDNSYEKEDLPYREYPEPIEPRKVNDTIQRMHDDSLWDKLVESRIDELSRPKSMQHAGNVLKKAGYSKLGEGSFGSVYYKAGADYVLKVFDRSDKAYIRFVRLALANRDNPCFPKFVGKLINVTDQYCAIRMEKLSPNWRDTTEIENYAFYSVSPPNGEYEVEYYDDAIEYMEANPQLMAAMDIIIDSFKDLIGNGYEWDLRPANVMKRGNVIVITDPVMSY